MVMLIAFNQLPIVSWGIFDDADTIFGYGFHMALFISFVFRHALSTTFRPIGEPNSNPETDPETEGVSSSSRSSRFEDARGGGGCGGQEGQTCSNPATPEDGEAEISTVMVCRLCLREFRPLPEPTAVVCSSLDCGASFHHECFSICKFISFFIGNPAPSNPYKYCS